MIKSFGYGVFLIEAVPSTSEKVLPKTQEELLSLTGIVFQEIAADPDGPGRIYAMAKEGHIPTSYELSQISNDDWEKIRTAIDLLGAQVFSDRLTMLEEKRL